MVNDIFDKHFAPSSDAYASPVGGETVILQLKNAVYFGLDAVGTRIWELLKEGHGPASICARMTSEFDAAPHEIEADVRRFLRELATNDIVVETARAGD